MHRTRLFIFITVLVGCIAQLHAAEAKKVSLQLQWLHQFQFAGYYMAKERGFYKEAGLDVAIKEYREGMDVVSDVLQGHSDFGIGRSSLIIDRMRGRPVVALGAVFQKSPHVLLVKESSGIKSPGDLRGKRVMITGDAAASAPIMAMLSNKGINRSDLILQSHSMNIRDLAEGRTDAMASYISNEPFQLKKMGVAFRSLIPQDYGFDFYSDIFFTSQNLLDDAPDTVDGFYSATIKGWQYAFEHIDETVELILKKYNTQQRSKEALLFEAESLKKLTDDETRKVPLGNLDPLKLKRIADIFMVLGQLDRDYSLDGFIYETHLQDRRPFHLSTAEKKWLKDHPRIRVGIDIAWPPFEFVDEEGIYKGMAAEYLHLIGKQLGITLEIEKELPWADVVKKMKARELDLYSCVVNSDERREYMDFTSPYLSFPMVIISNDDLNYIDGLKELEGKRVAVVKGYVTEELLRQNHPKIDLVPLKNVEEALDRVAYKKVYAYVGNIATASYYIKKLGVTNVKISGETPYRFELCMAGRNDWPMLAGIIQKALDAIDDKEKDRIYKKWISISYEHGFDYTLFWKILGGVLIVFSLVSVWAAILRRQVTLRKRAEARLNELNQTLEAEVKTKVEELRQRDKLLIQQSKMAAMGEMIGVIAHQLKQPLNAIGLISQDVKDAYEYNELNQEYIDSSSKNIMANINHMSATVDDFRNFFNPNKQKENFSVAAAISKAVDLLHAQYEKYAITIEVVCEDAKLYGLENEFQQIIINLVSNAKDAFLERNVKERLIRIESRPESSDAVVMEVCDTAGGIEASQLEKVFDAYFSTKGEKGTGIGLYMVRMIIKESFGGAITVKNSEKGACFSIRFPMGQPDTV